MTKNKDEIKNIIEEISYLHDELDSNRTPLVIKQVIELSPSEYSCAIKCIIQPILDNKLPCDNNSFSKQDHENILKCFYTFFTSNENNEGISDSKLMWDIMQCGKGRFNPDVIQQLINDVKIKSSRLKYE